jgi:hypothetical protein
MHAGVTAGRVDETDETEPGRGERNPAGTKSTAGHRRTIRHRERHNAGAGETSGTHNTLSADATHVQVFYPFHPLHGYCLRVIRRPKRGDGAVSVLDPVGKRLKIPAWMLSEAAARVQMAEQALLSREALFNLTSLLIQPTVTGIHDNLLQTPVSGCKGGHRAAATTLKPGPNRRGTRARRRDGQSRTGRSHGSHSGDGFSNGNKEDK